LPNPILTRVAMSSPVYDVDCQKAEETTNSISKILARVPRPWFRRNADVNEAQEQHAEEVSATVRLPEKDAPALEVTVAESEQAEPAVVSVKKSHRGCAVVILRDSALLERCVLQKVAVIDGICCEIRRHCKKSATEEERAAKQGLFVAWGNRVERRVSVSEEGLEAYFNSLVGAPVPEGLEVMRPFDECHQVFLLASEAGAMMSPTVGVDEATKEQIANSFFCSAGSIVHLWDAKKRIDDLWNKPPPPLARSLMTRVARAELFPHSDTGGKEHDNRAGDKLSEVADIVGLLEGVPPGSAFLDLCGGPGAWSQHLLARTDLSLRGFGFTLKAGAGDADDWQCDEKDEWYDDLYKHPAWTALWGEDGTGDLLKTGNLEHCASMLAHHQVMLCVADGGFSDKAIPPNQLELYFYRLFLGELLMAAYCLKPGGKFVCKLYTTFSTATAALLFLTTRLFDSVKIVKPMSSRTTGPERYLVAVGFKDNQQTNAIRNALMRSHNLGAGNSPLTTPLLMPVIESANLLRDAKFAASMREMTTGLCERQATAMHAVVDRAEFLEDMAMSTAVSSSSHWYKAAVERRRHLLAAQGFNEEGENEHDDRTERRERRDRKDRKDRGGHGEHRHRGSATAHHDSRPAWHSVPTPARAGARRSDGRYNGWQ